MDKSKVKVLSKEERRHNAVTILWQELNYHLMSLNDALNDGDITAQEIEKRELEGIRAKLIRYSALDSEPANN